MTLPYLTHRAVGKSFMQLRKALFSLSDDDYAKPLNVLSGSSIGQHTRHIIEFFLVLIEQYPTGMINYDKRERNLLLETNRASALGAITAIQDRILQNDKEVLLTGHYGEVEEITVRSTYHRELVYNLEHAIHHMAMIRIGIRQLTNIDLPPEFGVAASTTLFRQKN